MRAKDSVTAVKPVAVAVEKRADPFTMEETFFPTPTGSIEQKEAAVDSSLIQTKELEQFNPAKQVSDLPAAPTKAAVPGATDSSTDIGLPSAGVFAKPKARTVAFDTHAIGGALPSVGNSAEKSREGEIALPSLPKDVGLPAAPADAKAGLPSVSKPGLPAPKKPLDKGKTEHELRPSQEHVGLPSAVQAGLPAAVQAGLPSAVQVGLPGLPNLPASPPNLPAGAFAGSSQKMQKPLPTKVEFVPSPDVDVSGFGELGNMTMNVGLEDAVEAESNPPEHAVAKPEVGETSIGGAAALDALFDEPLPEEHASQVAESPISIPSQSSDHHRSEVFTKPADELPMIDLPEVGVKTPSIEEMHIESAGLRPEGYEGRKKKKNKAVLVMGILGALLLLFSVAGYFTGIFDSWITQIGGNAAMQTAIQKADKGVLSDSRKDHFAAMVELSKTRKTYSSPRLLSRSLMFEALWQMRYGSNAQSSSRAGSIRQRIEREGGLKKPEYALGLVAHEMQRGELEGSIPYFSAAKSYGPQDPFYHILAGEYAILKDKSNDAVVAFKDAIKNGGGVYAQWGLARAYWIGPNSKALEANPVDDAIASTLALSPKHPGALLAKAYRMFVKGDEKGAFALVGTTLQRGHDIAPGERAEGYNLLGMIHEKNGQLAESLINYNKALELNPQMVEALIGAGRTLLLDRPNDALARFETLIASKTPKLLSDGRSVLLEAQLGAAQAMLKVGRAQEATARLETLFGENPKDVSVGLAYGDALFQLNEHEKAETQFRKIITLAPEKIESYLFLARICTLLKRDTDANAALDEANLRVPESAQTRRARGQFELDRNQLDAAILEFSRARELDAHPATLYGLGVAYRRAGRIEEAEKTFDELGQLEPNYPGLVLERGRIFELKGLSSDAYALYLRAVEENPRDPYLLLRLGGAQVSGGRLDEAEQTLEKVAELLPTSADLEHFRGRIDFERGRFANASAHFERAVLLDPLRVDSIMYSAWTFLEMGSIDRSQERWKQGLEREPNHPDLLFIRGLFRLRGGAVRDAIEDFSKAETEKCVLPDLKAAQGIAYDQTQQTERAIAAFKKAIELSPRAEWYFRLGKLLLDNGRAQEAKDILIRATVLATELENKPNWLAKAHRYAGEIAERLRSKDEAIVHYKRYLELAPESDIDRRDVTDALRRLGIETIQ